VEVNGKIAEDSTTMLTRCRSTARKEAILKLLQRKPLAEAIVGNKAPPRG
jgi:hypothetical protein